MPYWANTENGVVIEVRKTDDDHIAANPHLYVGVWIKIPDMRQYPARGWTYDDTFGFRPPAPYPSWQWQNDDRIWFAPIPYPDDGQDYQWNESLGAWTLLTE